MTDKPENPPAYPIYSPDMNLGDTAGPGLSMRDYFAGQALAGDMASQSEETGEWIEGHYHNLAYRCYKIADAMLKERAKP